MDELGFERSKIMLKQLAALNREMAAWGQAGLQLEPPLTQTVGGGQWFENDATERLSERMKAGLTLLKAVEKERDVWPDSYWAAVEIGVRCGRLAEPFERLAELAQRAEELRRRFAVSLFYPLLIAGLAYVLFIGLLLFLVPELKALYQELELKPRQWLKALEWLHRWLFLWGPLLPALVVGWLVWLRTAGFFSSTQKRAGRWFPGRNCLWLATVADLLAILLEHGTPLPKALTLVAATCDLRSLAVQLNTAAERLRQSSDFETRQTVSVLPPLFNVLFTSAADSAQLTAGLREIAGFYQRQASHRLERFQRLSPLLALWLVGGSVLLCYGLALFALLAELYQSMASAISF